MNEKHIEDIITALYDLIQDARGLPLGADKCIVERDRVLDMLDEISAQLPAELKQSRTIVDSRNELIGQAKREAEGIIRKAQEEAARMVDQQTIYEEAKRKCAELVAQTQAQITNLRKVSNEYMDDALRRTEEAIAQSLEEVRDTRMKFKSLADAQEKKSASVNIDVE